MTFLEAYFGLSITTLVYFAIAFIVGGFIKGTLGVGLPLFVIPLLAYRLPAIQAIGILVLPVLVSNFWQSLQGGVSRAGLMRFWPLVLSLTLTTVLTVHLTLGLSDAKLKVFVSVTVLIAVVLLFLKLELRVRPERERLWSAGVGLASGLMGGVSSLTGPVIISYLMALKLPRDVFVGTISVVYLIGAISVYTPMVYMGTLTVNEWRLSALALLPMTIGLLLGQRLRGRLTDDNFRTAMLVFLCVIALGLIIRATLFAP